MKAKAGAKRTDGVAAAPFMWQDSGGECLLTNDFGFHTWLKRGDLAALLAGKLDGGSPVFPDLVSKGFIRANLDLDHLCAKWRGRNSHLFSATILHILVLTTRCDHACVYCQAAGGAVPDMTPRDARKCVDFAFQSPSPAIILEFQGGEPLLNWGTLKAAVEYAARKAKASRRKLHLTVVSNMSGMTKEKAAFLLRHGVSVCGSLDGPAALHNRNRVRAGGNSHAAAVKWLAYFKREAQKRKAPELRPAALLTVTRHSLPFHREIVDEYAKLGLRSVFIRPLAPMGRARQTRGAIGYTPAEFSDFYVKSLRYILELNRKGTDIREKTACIALEKIVNFRDAGYLDSRCPCGGGIGQMAYMPGGDIYTCDEGRMVATARGDQFFRMGNVYRDDFDKALASPAARGCVMASNLESHHACMRCVYKPFCGVCPVVNYEEQASPWGNMAVNERCAQQKGVFGALFALLREPASARLLKGWVSGHENA